MFRMDHERYSYPSLSRDGQGQFVQTEIVIDADVMIHESGFRLTRVGEMRPIKGIRYRYVKQNVAFDVTADRRHWGGTVTGTYLVSTNFTRGQKLGDETWPIDRAKMEAIAADIDIGLRAWPPGNEEEARPIGVVHFLFLTFGGFSRADYNFAFGAPLALRDQPPSRRWSKQTVQYYVDGKYGFFNPGRRQCASLIRDDGVYLVHIPTPRGPENDGPDSYRYVEPLFAFDFAAERRFSRGITTDTWEVRLDLRHQDGLSATKRARLGAGKCREIVGNIEEALFAWNPEPRDAATPKVPVNRVVFLDAP